MPLSFFAEGEARPAVSIFLDAHERLMAGHVRGKLLQRIDDFYVDASFSESELPQLRVEILDARRSVRQDAQLEKFLEDFETLIETAITARVGIRALAD